MCNFQSLSCIEVLECLELTSFPKGLRAEISSRDEENLYNFPRLRRRFGRAAEEEGYNCIPIPMLRLRLQSNKVDDDPSQNSSTSSTGVNWRWRPPFLHPTLTTNQ
ncbi:hypothetical protein L484_001512 [Morus notabilis]|uniref:Uncharacterized protein n=1 Tax=Morus notabilis TaxID=981085 RepID=W9QR66_9ROSA|nr:hypothetical protein L484_001512 [Morus notabilis]